MATAAPYEAAVNASVPQLTRKAKPIRLRVMGAITATGNSP
jgi:hypothetical protein